MRPKFNQSTVTTPGTAVMMQLLGATCYGAVALSRAEIQAIRKLYEFKPEGPNEKPAPPEPPKAEDFATKWKYEDALKRHKTALEAHAKWEDPKPLMQAGADRNALRHAEADGLRIIAWLAKYVAAGEDPLKHVVQLAIEAGFDVDAADSDWAYSES